MRRLLQSIRARKRTSMNTPWSSIALYSVAWILVLMATAASREWVPAMLTSGSTMGTRPTSWQMRA